jgi:hypothetical protein
MMQAVVGMAGFLLCVNGAWLIAQDKINFGSVLPVAIGAAWLLWAFKRQALNAVDLPLAQCMGGFCAVAA